MILEGKPVSQKIKEEVKARVQKGLKKYSMAPGLAVVLVGEDPASQVYVGHKIKACESLGITSFHHKLPKDTSSEKLFKLLQELNEDPKVHGILVQMPVPRQISYAQVLENINHLKDVDGLTAESIGRAWSQKNQSQKSYSKNHQDMNDLSQKSQQGDDQSKDDLSRDDQILNDQGSEETGKGFVYPCTPGGIIEILKFYNIPIEGKRAVVVGRSDIVGKPMAQLLLEGNATVTLCHSKTRDLKEETKRGEIVVLAAGQKKFFTKDYFSKEAIVIDVGIHRGSDGKLCGDVDFEDVRDHVNAITPVPGGVGPMTIAMLMKNTVDLYEQQMQARAKSK